jgi:ammonia channel protein AmtB
VSLGVGRRYSVYLLYWYKSTNTDANEGFMSEWGVLDFAGGDVVHISSGV